MNTEQLKTADEFLHASLFHTVRDTFPKAHESKLINDMSEFSKGHTANAIVKAMQDFASQESKIAVEKDRESRWITDRLPDDKLHVIVAFKWGNNPILVKYALFLKKDQFERENMFVIDAGFFTQDKIAGWQPLPEPPKLLNL